MSIEALGWAFNSKVGNKNAKLVLISLADQTNNLRQCWPSIKYLCRRCEMSRSSIYEAITYLVSNKFIFHDQRTDKFGRFTSSMFTLAMPASVEETEEGYVQPSDIGGLGMSGGPDGYVRPLDGYVHYFGHTDSLNQVVNQVVNQDRKPSKEFLEWEKRKKKGDSR